ncbi:MAG: HD domain-containing protein [Ruminiclostridium sp.]|nr:HD domain-containing protein [Ruminiclostridium sp.]
MNRFFLSPAASRGLALLREAGHEAWVVGGCVRDMLLGQIPKDYDITTSARPEETKAVFTGYRIIETGLRHGTVTVILDGEPLEITTYRVDGDYSDARHPDGVTFTRSLREDAARRDFTMNAMAYAPGEGLQDFFGGQADILDARIRAVGDPVRRFQEDALRILRGLRFASVLGFSLEEATEAAARQEAGRLGQISAERVSAELGKLLTGRDAGRILRAYPDILGQILPELLPMVGFNQRNVHHCYDLLTHTAEAVNHVPPELHLRLAMLLHDVGKPLCFSIGEDGQGHFYGHARESARLAGEILRRLRFPNQLREKVETLVRYHDAVLEEDPRILRRWLNRLGEETFFDLILIQRGDTATLAPAYRGRAAHFERLEALAREILAEEPCLQVKDLAVNGRDLMALGLEGREIGNALRFLLDQVLEGKLPNERTCLLENLPESCRGTPPDDRGKNGA